MKRYFFSLYFSFCSWYWFFVLVCFSVVPLYSMHDSMPDQDQDKYLLLRALDLAGLPADRCRFTNGFLAAQKFYKQGLAYKTHEISDNSKAYDCFRAAARLEHRPSCYELSILMREKRDYQQAIYWLLRAARAERVSALTPEVSQQMQLSWYLPALCYIEEIYAGIHGQELYKALLALAHTGDYYTRLFTQACNYYAEKQYAKAYELYASLGSYRHPLALYMLGVCCDISARTSTSKSDNAGNSVSVKERDVHKAYNYYKQAALYGYTQAHQACVWRDILAIEHVDTIDDTSKAALIDIWLAELIKCGTLEDNKRCVHILASKNMRTVLERYVNSSAYAAYICGLWYKNKQIRKSDSYLEIAAQKDIVRANFTLGQRYLAVNPKKAFYYYLNCALADVHTQATTEYEQELKRKAYKIIAENADKQDDYACICFILCNLGCEDIQVRTQALHVCERIFSKACDDPALVKLIAESALPATLALFVGVDPRIDYLRALLYLNVPGFIDQPEGIRLLKLAASKGIPEAQVTLSSYLKYGIKGVEKDFAQAFSLLVQAHEQGFYLATFYLACAYKDGILVPIDNEKSQELLNNSCLDHYVLALCYRAADLIEYRPHESDAIAKVLALLEVHAQAEDADACATLGFLYYSARESWGKDKLARAFKYLKKAAEAGCTRAYRILGRMLYFEEGVKGNKASGEKLLWKARSLGDQEVIGDLADIFYSKQEYQKAFMYYLEIYKLKQSADAAAGLALCYVKGHGVKQDIRQAVNYMSIALKKGAYTQAGSKSLPKIHLNSLFVQQVFPSVFGAVKELVNNGDAAARFMLELLLRVLHDVGFTLIERKGIFVVYPRVCDEEEL